MWNKARLLMNTTAYLKHWPVFKNDLKRLAYYTSHRGCDIDLISPSHNSYYYSYRLKYNIITRRNSSYSDRKNQKFLLENRISNLNDVVKNNKAACDSSERTNSCTSGSDFKCEPKEEHGRLKNLIGNQQIDKHITINKIKQFGNVIDPYFKLMRIDKPVGSWLLFWPCSWSIVLASDPSVLSAGGVAQTLGLFLAGAVVMRGAGCTINDMWDKDIDAQVERTRSRPLVSGEISRKKALIFLAGQLSLGLTILLQLNWYSVALGASSMVLVVLYPLAKRVTDYPQLVLGLAFNWGALLGWSAVAGQVDPAVCLPLYAAGVCWTLLYDTIYAHQDKRDDAIIGVRSTALKFGSYTKPCLALFSGGMVSCLTAVGVAADLGLPYFMTLGLVGAHTAKQIITLDTENPQDCAEKFVSNSTVGMLIFFGILAGKWKTIKQYVKEMQSVDGKQPLLLQELVH